MRRLKYVPTARVARQPGDQDGGRRADDRDAVGEHGEERRRLLSVFSSAPDTRPTGNRYRARFPRRFRPPVAVRASRTFGKIQAVRAGEYFECSYGFLTGLVVNDFHFNFPTRPIRVFREGRKNKVHR